MDFELNIKNIGKLTNAKIEIGQFTVFAGPNNTGKSFVSKALYSLFDAMNVNHAEVYIQNLTKPIRNPLMRLMRLEESINSITLYTLLRKIRNIENAFKDSTIEDIDELGHSISNLAANVSGMRKEIFDICTKVKSIDTQQLSLIPSRRLKTSDTREEFRMVEDSLKDVGDALTELHKKLSKINAKKFIADGIEHKIRENLIQNFQVPSLTDLQGKEDVLSKVEIKGFGIFEFENEEIRFNITQAGVRKLQQYSDVIYLESPVYWKLKNALENLRIHPRYLRRRERISGVPGYFYDLASALKDKYTGNTGFPSLSERLTGKDILGGKIVISENGDLSFQENGHNFSLPVTAMGVANLGVLALLIERKILDKDSFLFIDEPEAHLHPAWQVVMAETLFELAKGGVNVVIATHSADILKWLEVHVKKNPDDEGMIALNKFPANGDETEGQDFKDKMAAIKKELTKPFADLYIEGLL